MVRTRAPRVGVTLSGARPTASSDFEPLQPAGLNPEFVG